MTGSALYKYLMIVYTDWFIIDLLVRFHRVHTHISTIVCIFPAYRANSCQRIDTWISHQDQLPQRNCPGIDRRRQPRSIYTLCLQYALEWKLRHLGGRLYISGLLNAFRFPCSIGPNWYLSMFNVSNFTNSKGACLGGGSGAMEMKGQGEFLRRWVWWCSNRFGFQSSNVGELSVWSHLLFIMSPGTRYTKAASISPKI